jgi:hypothetical protein
MAAHDPATRCFFEYSRYYERKLKRILEKKVAMAQECVVKETLPSLAGGRGVGKRAGRGGRKFPPQ